MRASSGSRAAGEGATKLRAGAAWLLTVAATTLALPAPALRADGPGVTTPVTHPVTDPAAERAAIERVVTDAYVDGVHNFRDPAAMRRGFHPDFEMLMLREGKLVRVPLAKWIEAMEARNQKEPPPKASPDAPRPTTARFVAVEIAGTAATCKVEIWRDGKQIYTDFLALYRFEEGWQIVSKTFFSHP